MKKDETTLQENLPERIIIPGKLKNRTEPEGQDIILTRVPGVDYALYRAPYPMSRWNPRKSISVVPTRGEKI